MLKKIAKISGALTIMVMQATNLQLSSIAFVNACEAVATNNTSQSKPRRKVIKKEGWQIPGIKDFTKVSNVKPLRVNDIEVSQKVYQSESEPIVDIRGNTIELNKQKANNPLFAVRDFIVYEVKGHIFGYGVTLIPVQLQGETRIYAGAMYNMFYLDEDGNGIFEARYSGLPLPDLPQWIKQNKEKSSN